MIFTKEDEGEIIFAKGTGNNTRRNKGATRFKVVKVKRKYVDLSIVYEDGTISRHTDSYLPENGATQSSINQGYGGNAGYLFFRNEDEITKHDKSLSMKQEIRDYFTYSFSMDYEGCKKILDVIKAQS